MAELGKLKCMAIGSLPHINSDDAMAVVKTYFSEIPFCPQLSKINKNEDMIIQFTENMPSFFNDDETGKYGFRSEDNQFFDELERFFLDYEEIISDINSPALDRYAISSDYSLAFEKLIDIVKSDKPAYVKCQIAGPFTLSSTLVDSNNRSALYDDTLREIVIKTLSIKALWQIKQIKSACPSAIPIVFIDEPSLSQLGTSVYLTISQDEVVDMLKEISDLIKQNGAVSAIHCCGKCDWTVPIRAGVDIINLDAFSFAQNLSVFHKDVSKFLSAGGKIAWGIVPTLDKKALEEADLEMMTDKFDNAVKYLTKKGIDEKLIIENSLITPSCGAGGLTEELALKAMDLTKKLSDSLKERYKY